MYKQIPGWSNYVINEDGEIKNKKHMCKSLGWVGNRGYKMVTLSENDNPKTFTIHGLMSLVFFNHKTTFELCINHKDANKLNNKISNLEIVTQKENRDHAKILGLYKSAIDAMAKSHKKQRQLVAWQVEKIRAEYIPKVKPLRHFAEMFGVSVFAVFDAYHGRTWQELKKVNALKKAVTAKSKKLLKAKKK